MKIQAKIAVIRAEKAKLAGGESLAFQTADGLGAISAGFIGSLPSYRGFVVLQVVDDRIAVVDLMTTEETVVSRSTGKGNPPMYIPTTKIVKSPV